MDTLAYQTKFNSKRTISSEDIDKIVMFWIYKPCDLELQDRNPLSLHGNLVHDDALPYQVWFQKVSGLEGNLYTKPGLLETVIPISPPPPPPVFLCDWDGGGGGDNESHDVHGSFSWGSRHRSSQHKIHHIYEPVYVFNKSYKIWTGDWHFYFSQHKMHHIQNQFTCLTNHIKFELDQTGTFNTTQIFTNLWCCYDIDIVKVTETDINR